MCIRDSILRKQSIVDRQSAPDKKLLICVVPFAKDPNITALWLIDLSPGIDNSPLSPALFVNFMFLFPLVYCVVFIS